MVFHYVVNCSLPEDPPQGSYLCQGHVFSDHCDVICDVGYLPETDDIWGCSWTGNWTAVRRGNAAEMENAVSADTVIPQTLACVIADCGNILIPAHGDVTCTGKTYGETCHLTCHDGYERLGQDDFTCQVHRVIAQAAWSGEPVCIPVSCGAPPEFPHTAIQCASGHTYGNTCEVACADGYEGTNLQNVTCHSTGNWSLQAGALQPVVGGPDLFCKKKDCGNISSPVNGGLTCSGTRYQDSCRLTCEPGYKVADESGHVLHSLYNFRCMASGQWNKKPRCVPSDYCHLGLHDCHAEHGVCSLSGHQAFSCRCRVGTVGDGRHCERTSCPDFPVAEPENGFFSCSILTSSAADTCQSPDSTEPEYEVVCVLHCDPGYDRLIYAEYSCGHGGNWSIPFNTNNPGTTPCLAVKCPDLSSPLNGSMTCDSGYEFRHPEACSFACDTGYELTPTSSSVRHCKADATWSGSDAKCIGVRCPTLSSPMNGKMSCNSAILPSAFRHPETCNFTCHDGFGLSTGSNKISRTCQADGTWSESNAVCVCVASSDLFFVLDGSGSVGTGNFDAVKTFVANIVSTFIIGATATRVGVVQYSSSNTLEFNLGSHTSQTATVNAISAITYQNGGTLTGAAMDFARQHAAWRPSPIRRIMIVVTDGSSHDSVVAPSQALTADGVTVFAIGVSGYESTQLLQITNNVPSRVFELTDFIGLSQNINQIVQALCNL